MSPRTDESPAATGLPNGSGIETSTIVRPARYRRNAHRQGARVRQAEFVGLASAERGAAAPACAGSDAAARAAGLQLPRGATARDAWIGWLAPHFADQDACYFTGTYSDDYGTANGLMLQRNVHKDFTRFLESFDYQGDYIVGVEQHAFRDILHLHGILQGPFSDDQRRWVKEWWQAERGHARALPVQDGCASYVTKYALKGDTDAFEWRLT